MKYGLKFAQMRSIDGHSTQTEKQLYDKVIKKIDCLFMIKFWFMYWLSSVHYSYLALNKGEEKASEFIEHFAFIMHMKNLVKL